MMELMKYVSKAKKAISEAYWELENAIMAKNSATEKIKAKAASDSSYTLLEANEDTEKVNNDYDQAYSDLCNKCSEALAAIQEEFAAEVHDFYRPDGAKINEADQKLLNSGIDLDRFELCEMVIRNAENVTMLRLIAGFVEKNGMKGLPSSIEKALYRATKAGALEAKAFSSFVHLASMGLKHQDGGYVHVQRRLDEYEADAKTAFDKAKLYVSPDEMKVVEAAELARKENYQPLTENFQP